MKCGLAIMGLSLVAATLTVCVGPATAGKAAKPPMKIGVYDSRGVAIAYARSAEFQEKMAKLRSDHEEAKARGDDQRMKELEQEGSWGQVRLHQQGFSTAGAGDLLAKVSDVLPRVAREAGVVLIVSKWEPPYRDASVEVVDVTLPLAKLFKPDEQTLKILGELKDQTPIPFDEISLEPND
jgi:hypothetical protein